MGLSGHEQIIDSGTGRWRLTFALIVDPDADRLRRFEALVSEMRGRLCRLYDIPVTRWSLLTHAEIQPTFGIVQRWKWDITWLPGMPAPADPIEVGDRLRAMVRAELQTL